ncbi:MAG: SDR family NAD(P)-dependent oxidoreductase, partial [Gammaproteobacteria bacterium]|nr:SDR family NAD(P)-dependent oxidoreductase [Gammaproteobacteria bacterium]
MRLENKRVIITAGASGIGAAGVELFAAEGAHVVAVDRDAESLKALSEEVKAAGGNIDTLTADLL